LILLIVISFCFSVVVQNIITWVLKSDFLASKIDSDRLFFLRYTRCCQQL
jgi:hypothetical protein